MKLAIDCRLIGHSGIGTYIENVVSNIFHCDNISFLLIGAKEKLSEYAEYKNVTLLDTNISIFSLSELFCPSIVSKINKCDAYFTPYINLPLGIKVPVFCTIHDVLFFDQKHIVSRMGKLIRWLYFKYAIYKSSVIFTVSDFSKKRIQSIFHTNKSIIVTYNGVSNEIKKYEQQKIKKQNYFIYVGNIKPHKGLGTLIKAYQKAQQDGLNKRLVIVGEYRNFKTTDKNTLKIFEKNRNNIEFTGYLSNECLIKKIQTAQALIQPSSYEGFGIPPLEALYLGTDVILSDIPVFKEVYSTLPVAFFRCGDIDSLKRLLVDFRAQNYSVKFVQEQIDNKYNFKIVADKILNTIATFVKQ